MPSNPISNNRLAFQYFPDSDHFSQKDLQTWVPVLQSLGAGWLILRAPHDRAIPEDFLRGLLSVGIQPVVHLDLPPAKPPTPEDLEPLFKAYARWGVRYLALFDRPNARATWGGVSWARQELVASFLNLYIPLAEAALDAGLINIFPPLQPGGDYWDTAFLEAALGQLKDSPHAALLNRLALGVYAWADNLPLDWGAGGPECWPGTQPYYTPNGEEDHQGFRIFDWYNAICLAVVGRSLPQIGLGGGCRLSVQRPEHPPLDREGHAEASLHLLQLLDGEDAASMPPLPGLVLACSLGLLTASPQAPESADAWISADGTPLPSVGRFKEARGARQPRPLAKNFTQAPASQGRHQPGLETVANPGTLTIPSDAVVSKTVVETIAAPTSPAPKALSQKPIQHYVLLPTYEWGVADWHLAVIQPFLKRHLPTVGFSLREAAAAERVTVIGGAQSFPDGQLDELRNAGCEVVRISGDGTTIASQLETL